MDADAMRPSADVWTAISAMQLSAMQQSFSATLDVLQYRFQINYLSATVLAVAVPQGIPLPLADA